MADIEKPIENIDPRVEQIIDEKLGGFMTEMKKMMERKYPEPTETRKGPKIEVIGSRGPQNKQDKFMKSYRDANPDKTYRLLYGHADNLPLRRMDGWEPVREAGNEVRFGDHILASMPKNRYQEEIVDKREAKIERKRVANAQKLEENAKDAQDSTKNHVETNFSGTYKVTYDKEEKE